MTDYAALIQNALAAAANRYAQLTIDPSDSDIDPAQSMIDMLTLLHHHYFADDRDAACRDLIDDLQAESIDARNAIGLAKYAIWMHFDTRDDASTLAHWINLPA